jgi:hypothetical protein
MSRDLANKVISRNSKNALNSNFEKISKKVNSLKDNVRTQVASKMSDRSGRPRVMERKRGVRVRQSKEKKKSVVNKGEETKNGNLSFYGKKKIKGEKKLLRENGKNGAVGLGKETTSLKGSFLRVVDSKEARDPGSHTARDTLSVNCGSSIPLTDLNHYKAKNENFEELKQKFTNKRRKDSKDSLRLSSASANLERISNLDLLPLKKLTQSPVKIDKIKGKRGENEKKAEADSHDGSFLSLRGSFAPQLPKDELSELGSFAGSLGRAKLRGVNSPQMVHSHPLSLNQNFKKSALEKNGQNGRTTKIVKENGKGNMTKIKPFPSFAKGSQNQPEMEEKEKKEAKPTEQEEANEVSSMKISFVSDGPQFQKMQLKNVKAPINSTVSPTRSFLATKNQVINRGSHRASLTAPSGSSLNDGIRNKLMDESVKSDTNSSLLIPLNPKNPLNPQNAQNGSLSNTTTSSYKISKTPRNMNKTKEKELAKSASPAKRKKFIKGCLKKAKSSIFHLNHTKKPKKKVHFNKIVETSDKEKLELNDKNKKKQGASGAKPAYIVQHQPMYPMRDYSKPIPRAGVKVAAPQPESYQIALEQQKQRNLTPPRNTKPIKRVSVVQSPNNMARRSMTPNELPSPYTLKEAWKEPNLLEKRNPTPGRVTKAIGGQRAITKVSVVSKPENIVIGQVGPKGPEKFIGEKIEKNIREKFEKNIRGNFEKNVRGNSGFLEKEGQPQAGEERRSLPQGFVSPASQKEQRFNSPMRKFDQLLMKAAYLNKQKNENIKGSNTIEVQGKTEGNNVSRGKKVVQEVEETPILRSGSFLKQRMLSPQSFRKETQVENSPQPQSNKKKRKKKKNSKNQLLGKKSPNPYRRIIPKRQNEPPNSHRPKPRGKQKKKRLLPVHQSSPSLPKVPNLRARHKPEHPRHPDLPPRKPKNQGPQTPNASPADRLLPKEPQNLPNCPTDPKPKKQPNQPPSVLLRRTQPNSRFPAP